MPLCNLTSAQPSTTVLIEVGMKLLGKVKKSNVIDVKAVIKSDSRKNKTKIAIKRKAKQIMNQLLWKESPFEDAAATCNYDGSKTAAHKSKSRQSLLTNFANLHVSQEKEVKSLFPTGTDWLSDFHIHNRTEFLKSTLILKISVMYPMPAATLYTIFSSKTKTLEEVMHREKHCVIPISINAQWAVLYLGGNRNQTYYLDTYGNKPNDQLVRNVQQKFANRTILCNSVKLQNDSYQCGAWSCYFISVIFEFLKNSLKPSIPFEQLIKISLNVNHLCDVRINRNNINSNFISQKRLYFAIETNKFIKMLEQNECDANNVTINATTHNDYKFTFDHLPNDIHFHTVAIDSQHLLWIDPHVSNGIQYIKFLSKYTVTKYLDQLNAVTLYMNFDLPSVVSNSVPKSNTQKQRDKNTTTKTEYSTTRVLCENKNTISDH